MFERLTDRARKVMSLANQEAQLLNHELIDTPHLLLGLVKEGTGVAVRALKRLGVELPTVRVEVEKLLRTGPEMNTMGKLPQTLEAKRVVQLAIDEARSHNHNYVGTEHLLLGLLRQHEGIAAQVLRKLGVKETTLRAQVLVELARNDAPAIPKTDEDGERTSLREQLIAHRRSSCTSCAVPSGAVPSEDERGRFRELLDSLGGFPSIGRFTVDLTEHASKRAADTFIGRADDLERIMQVLLRRKKCSPVLIGEPGVGKTAIVDGIAQLIVAKCAPEPLANARLLALDVAAIAAASRSRRDFDSRVRSVLLAARNDRTIILFVDDVHALICFGAGEDGTNAATLLEPMLRSGSIHLIAATTASGYNSLTSGNADLAHRLHPIHLAPTNPQQTEEILHGAVKRYERHHAVTYTIAALRAVSELTALYLPNCMQPGTSIDILDTAGSRARGRGNTVDAPLIRDVIAQLAGVSIPTHE